MLQPFIRSFCATLLPWLLFPRDFSENGSRQHISTRRLLWVDGVVGYRICLTHRRSSVRAWVDSYFESLLMHLLLYKSIDSIHSNDSESLQKFILEDVSIVCTAMQREDFRNYMICKLHCIYIFRDYSVIYCNPHGF